MKKILLRSIIIFLITVFLFYYVLKDNFNESIRLLLSSNFLYVFLAISTCFIAFLLETYILKLLINRHKKNYTYKNALLLEIMTKFFNGITPFSLGGQPLQVYELSKNDVKVTDGILVITEVFIIHEITLFILTLTAITFRYVFHIIPNDFLWVLTLVGVSINFIALLATIFISLKIGTAKKIGKIFIKLLNKLHIIKNDEQTIEKFNEKCMQYSNGFKELLSNKKIVFKCILLNILNLSLFFSIGFFTILAIDSSVNINYFYSLFLAILVYVSATFVPIPGGSVGAEYAYVNYFNLIIPENVVVTSLILWRFISYYLPMIIGGIIFNIVDNKRAISVNNK